MAVLSIVKARLMSVEQLANGLYGDTANGSVYRAAIRERLKGRGNFYGLVHDSDSTRNSVELPRTVGDLDPEEAATISAVREAGQRAYKAGLMPAEGTDWGKAPSLQPLAPACRFYLRHWEIWSTYLSGTEWSIRRIITSLQAWASIDEGKQGSRRDRQRSRH